MAKYIPLDALVAEIKRRFLEDYNSDDIEMNEVAQGVLASLKYFIDTLEVKEVDLQSEIDRVWDNTSDNFLEDCWKEFEDIAKHFFELGLKAQKGE